MPCGRDESPPCPSVGEAAPDGWRGEPPEERRSACAWGEPGDAGLEERIRTEGEDIRGEGSSTTFES